MNPCEPNNIASKYTKHIMLEVERESEQCQ